MNWSEMKDFRYRGYSMTELDEMIDAHKNQMTDKVVIDNARLRMAIRQILKIIETSWTVESDIEALCKEVLEKR